MAEALPQLSQFLIVQAQGVVRAGAEGEKAGKPLLFVQGQPVAHCPAVTAEQGGYFLAGPHLAGLDQIEGMDSLRDSLGKGFGKKRLQLLCTFQDGRQAAIHGELQIKQSHHSSWIVSTRKWYKPLDGDQEAKLIAMRLGSPPKGFANWTLRLLAQRVVQLEIVDSISPETVRKTLKKTTSRRGKFSTG